MEHHHQNIDGRSASTGPGRTFENQKPNRQEPNDHKAGLYQRELERARQELDEERHRPLGFADDIKTLFGWFETPEERVHRNRPDLVD